MQAAKQPKRQGPNSPTQPPRDADKPKRQQQAQAETSEVVKKMTQSPELK